MILLERSDSDAASSGAGWDAVEGGFVEVEYRIGAVVGCVFAIAAHAVVAAIEYRRIQRIKLYSVSLLADINRSSHYLQLSYPNSNVPRLVLFKREFVVKNV